METSAILAGAYNILARPILRKMFPNNATLPLPVDRILPALDEVTEGHNADRRAAFAKSYLVSQYVICHARYNGYVVSDKAADALL